MRAALRTLATWIVLGALVGAACGIASALFLFLLERATQLREAHEVIVFALPVAGLAIGWLYERWGVPIRGGNDLVLDTVHDPTRVRLPLRMAPMVMIGTVLTHVFGGSAGREGTAVQMGASLADALSHRFGLDAVMRKHLLIAGIAGGFGSVFGTPWAGAVFGVEVLAIGRVEHRSVVPAVIASFVGDLVTRSSGIVHTPYPTLAPLPLDALRAGQWAVFAIAVALTATAFIELTHGLKRVLAAHVPRLPVRMAIGGVVIVVLWQALGTSDYLGLGVPTILRAFEDPELPIHAFALKLLFTAITLGAGYLGGEVTPLFFVGATLGSVMARAMGLPIGMGAAVGMASLFGAAANAPIALSIMAVELCGPSVMPHVLIVTLLAFVMTGHRSIYGAQRVARTKWGGARKPETKRLADEP